MNEPRLSRQAATGWQAPAIAVAAGLLLTGALLEKRPELVGLASGYSEPSKATPEGAFGQREYYDPQASLGPGTGATFMHRLNPRRTGYLGDSPLVPPLQEVWRTEDLNFGVHSASKSSPAVDNDGIFVGSDVGWFYKFRHDGSLAWRFRFSRADFGVHGTAALDEKYVYVGAYNGQFYCLRKTDGALVWTTRLADAVGSSAALIGDAVAITSETGPTRNGYAALLDRATGKARWRSGWIGEQVHCSPTLDPSLTRVYYGANNGAYTAVAFANGETAWKSMVGGPVKGVAAFYELGGRSHLLFASWAKALHCLDASNGAERWRFELPGRAQGSPTLFERLGLAVIGAGETDKAGVWGIDLDTGKARWKRPQPGGQNKGSGVGLREIASGRDVYWGPCESSKLCAIEAKSGKLIQELNLGGTMSGAPAVYGRRLYVALDNGGLAAFEAARSAGDVGAKETSR